MLHSAEQLQALITEALTKPAPFCKTLLTRWLPTTSTLCPHADPSDQRRGPPPQQILPSPARAAAPCDFPARAPPN